MSKHPKPTKIRADRCKGCELCVAVCRTKALKMTDTLDARGNRIAEIVADGKCDRCGRCFLICPDNAILECGDNESSRRRRS